MQTGTVPRDRPFTNPVGKALWFIESHFASEIALDEIADIAGVSRYHMTRAFGDTTGHSIMRYVRGRRLTEAARALVGGAPDILTVALDAGYGSQEAFSRARSRPRRGPQRGPSRQHHAPGANQNGRDRQDAWADRAL